MTEEKRKRLEEAGMKVGTVAEFLELTPEQEILVEMGALIARLVRETREAKGLSQRQLADLLGKHQPQVARLEREGRASFESQFAALFKMGVNPQQIGDAIKSIQVKILDEKMTTR